MKNVLRFTSLALTVSLMVSVFAGCGSEKKDAQSTTESSVSTQTADTPKLAATWKEFEKKHEINVSCIEMGWSGPTKDLDMVTPEIEKRTNLKFNYEPVTVGTYDDLNQKLNLMVASKNLPDVFFGLQDPYSLEIYNRLGKGDLIWDVAPLIKDYAGISKLIEPELLQNRTADGNNYFIPTQTGKGNDVLHAAPGGIYFRTDFLKQLGMEYPKTPDELYTYLKRCKDEIKTVNGKSIIPITIGENLSGLRDSLYSMYWSQTLGPEKSGFTFDPDNGFKVVNEEFSNSVAMMEASKFISKLYREKLLDNEILTHKDAQMKEKVSAGRVACFPANSWDANSLGDVAKQVVPGAEYVFSPVIGNNAKYIDRKWTNNIGMYSTLFINKKLDEEVARHLLAVMDYLSTKDGQLLVQMGIEGKTYEYDSNGKVKFTEQFKKDTNNLDWNKQAGYGVGYWAQFVYNSPAIIDLMTEYPGLLREDNKKSWENNKHRWDMYDISMAPTKDYYFMSGELETKKIQALFSLRDKYYVKILQAKSDEDVQTLVNEYDKECKNLGIDEIVAERQKNMDNSKVK